VHLSARLHSATDDAVRADLASLPRMIDEVDGWIGEGVLGGPQRNAADFQVATSLRQLLGMEDLRPLLEGRPAERLAREVVPDFSARVGPVFPRDWLPG
jgi:glutathione S-transferase